MGVQERMVYFGWFAAKNAFGCSERRNSRERGEMVELQAFDV